MSVKEKPARPAPDPNSAKFKLGKILEKHYVDVFEAKERGEKIGWISSNFPQEIFETLGIKVCFPENQAAAIAARGAGAKLCEIAEADGYSNDICAYARISLAYTKIKSAPEQDMPMPDFMLCCNNICNLMIKWYENIAKELDIPLILIDIPFNHDYDVPEPFYDYIEAQIWDAVGRLEEITGKKWDDEKFKEVMANSNRTARAWDKASGYTACKPSPLSGFDLLNHMAVAVVARGQAESAEAFETLTAEYEQAVKDGTSTFRTEEKYRIMFEGIACWPHLRATFKGLKDRGINMVGTIYANGLSRKYDDMRGLIKSYVDTPNCMSLAQSKDIRVGINRDTSAEGMLVHTNRSCKLWSGFMSEMCRQICDENGIPVVAFDGDQADPRCFSEAQYDTRVQGLMETMEAAKGGM